MSPKICLTASAHLIYQEKILLIKHKKIKKWLSPGGHVDENELPHLAAVREFLEETGLRVKVYSAYPQLANSTTDQDFFHPLPFAINEHWICKNNYQNRLFSLKNQTNFKPDELWSKGCEKHLNFCYLVQLVGPLEIKPEQGESQEVAWFSLQDLQDQPRDQILPDVYKESIKAFELAKLSHS